MKKLIFFDAKPYDTESFRSYADGKTWDLRFVDARLTVDTAPLTAGADGVCVFVNDTVDAAVIDILQKNGVRALVLRCAGYNNVDLSHAYGRLHVAHVPAYSPYAVAEHAMALLLTSVRRTHKAYIRTRDSNFSLAGLVGFDLHGKTIGVVGTGRIGQAFISICRGFGMRVIAYDKFPKADSDIDYVPLEELYRTSDIISFHCPLTEETHHIFSYGSLPLLKRGVILVNTSRGALIDSEALLAGIKERTIGAACLDVYEEESDIFFEDRSGHIIDDDTLARLISMPNVLLTSHQAFLTREALAAIAQTTMRNFDDLLRDGFSENELCYRCGRIDVCRREKRQRCF